MKKQNYLKIFLIFCCQFLHNIYCHEIILNVLVDQILLKNDNSLFLFENVGKINDLYDLQFSNFFDVPLKAILQYSAGNWFLNKKKLRIKTLQLSPHDSDKNYCLMYKNNQYHGNMILFVQDDKILIINQIPLEEYVKAVIAKEVFPGWNAEALKTIAIVIRTYALHLWEEAQKRNKIYHITNTIKHQKYDGMQSHLSIDKAVLDTRGMVIVDKKKKKPILAMYHVCCGGVIPIECVGFDFYNHPYLKRKKQCTGCQRYKFFHWKKQVNYMCFLNKLKEVCADMTIIKVSKINKISYSKTGAVRRLCIEVEVKKNKKGSMKKNIILNNKSLRKIFNIKLSRYSSCFTIIYDEDFNFIIEGKGAGHHIGLCQRGMYEYSKQGKICAEIIDFYYPYTEIINYVDIMEKNNEKNNI